MHLITILALALFYFIHVAPVSASQPGCSYKKSVRQAGTVFEISSRPAAGCAVQIVTISTVRGGGRAVFKADVDYLAHAAQAADLTGDGKPELIVFSKTPGTPSYETLDVYFMYENAIRRAVLPDLDDRSGYRGRDRFQIEGRLIVRKVPVYRESDADGNPSGGLRTLKYEFRDGRIELHAQNETLPTNVSMGAVEAPLSPKASAVKAEAATSKAPTVKVNDAPIINLPARTPEEPSRYRAISQPVPDKRTAKAVVSNAVITAITAIDAGIEIAADGKIENYKIMMLEKPERIAIDIPGATSALSGKKITIDKFGISKVRVGLNKGFLRIVLDTAQTVFPKHSVTASGNGLMVGFSK